LQRFWRDYEFDYVAWVKLIVTWMSDDAPWILSLDRSQRLPEFQLTLQFLSST